MSLGKMEGDQSKSWRCGVEVEYNDDWPRLLNYNLSNGFDFVVVPLVNPSYRSGSVKSNESTFSMTTLEASDLRFSSSQWNYHVVGKISSWIDLDSDNEDVRLDSEIALEEEIAWASHFSLQACILPPPKNVSCGNYARWANLILEKTSNMQLWLRIPLENYKSRDDFRTNEGSDLPGGRMFDSWEWWNSFRLLCKYHSHLCVVLDILSYLPPNNSIERWFGEPVTTAILHTSTFSTNRKGHPCLSKQQRRLITEFFHHSVQIVFSGSLLHTISSGDVHVEVTPIQHELKPYLDYVASIYQLIKPLTEQECLELGHRDVLLSPRQPLTDDMQARFYQASEQDVVKYNQYQRALCEALIDRVPDEKVSTIVTVLIILGAERGPLVRASLQAAEKTGRQVRVYAVEKNLYAAVALRKLVKLEGWENLVSIIPNDIRCWSAPEKADILVGELFGSFGDNELSPECFDAAQVFLNPDGISIPSTYTSFLEPVIATKLHNAVKSNKDRALSETPYVVKLHRVARLARSQPAFTFRHPDYSSEGNTRYRKLQFNIPSDFGSKLMHGFAGYFHATLYKDVHLCTVPSSIETPNLFSWLPMYFPLRNPLYVPRGSVIEAHFWRCTSATKVWYEWCVSSPSVSPIHNSNGRSSWVELFR